MADATLKVVVLGDVKDAERALQQLSDKAGDVEKTLGEKFRSVGDKMANIGGNLTKTVTLPLIGAGAAAIKLAADQEEAEAKLAATFDSMGAGAFTTVEALKAQASALQETTKFGDEAIIGFQDLLLTFGNVRDEVGEGNDIFQRSTQLGLDMSEALGQDLKSSAIQLGKALNDPIKGVTALQRVGVSFTEDQKDQIKTLVESGNTLEAQKLILGELEKQFGGTAAAAAQTTGGQLKQATNALGDAAEQIGAVLAPIVVEFSGVLKELVGRFQALSPETKEWIVRIAGIAAAVGPVLLIGGKLIGTLGNIGKAFKALSAILSANPYVLIIAATVALVTLIVTNWDKIKEFLGKAWEAIKQVAETVWNAIKDFFGAALEFMKNLFLNWTLPGLIIKHWDKIKEGFRVAWDFVKDIFKKALDFVVNLFLNWTLPGLLIKHWDTIKEGVQSVWDFFVNAWNAIVDFFKSVPGKIADAARGMFDGIRDAFKSAINWIIRKWNDFEITIGGWTLPSWLGGGKLPSFTVSTPNIPLLHSGGVYRAPMPGGEGLAVLKDRETVLPAGSQQTIILKVGEREMARWLTTATRQMVRAS